MQSYNECRNEWRVVDSENGAGSLKFSPRNLGESIWLNIRQR